MPTPKTFDPEQSSGMSMIAFNKAYRYWLLFKRYWWIMLIAGLGGILVQYYLIGEKPVEYVSKGRMMVSARLSLPDGVSYSEELANFFGTQIEIMVSMEVMQASKQALKKDHPEVQGEAVVSATQIPKTSIFELYARGTNPEYTRLFLDAVMDEFIEFKRDKRQETSFAAISQLTAELSRLKKEQEEQQKALFDFKKKYNISYWEAQSTAGTRYLSDLKDQEAKLKTKIKFLESLSVDAPENVLEGKLSLEGQNNEKITAEAIINAGILEDLPTNEAFKTEYFDSQNQLLKSQIILDDLLRVLRPEHPKIKALEENISRLQNFLNLLLYRNLETAKSNLNVLKKELQNIQSTIKEWEDNVLQSSQIQAEYETIQLSLDRTKNLYSSLLTSVQRLEITENVNVETIQILQKAEAALEAPRNWLLGIMEGALAGIFIGLFIIVLIDIFDDRLISSLDVEAAFKEPILTQIPQLAIRNEQDLGPILQIDEHRLPFAESFRNLRSSIIFKQENQQLKTIIVCGSLPGEGKSSVAANLAITMSQTGEKILLIDGDLRRGNLSKIMHFDEKPGITEALDDIKNWDKYTYKTDHSNLFIMPLGKMPSQPGELFLRPSLDLLLTQAKQQFDRIIFDSAPLLAVTDAASLAPKLDAVVMVIRSGLTPLQKAKQAMSSLESRQANIFGIIINGIDEFAPGYGYYKYKNYYY